MAGGLLYLYDSIHESAVVGESLRKIFHKLNSNECRAAFILFFPHKCWSWWCTWESDVELWYLRNFIIFVIIHLQNSMRKLYTIPSSWATFAYTRGRMPQDLRFQAYLHAHRVKENSENSFYFLTHIMSRVGCWWIWHAQKVQFNLNSMHASVMDIRLTICLRFCTYYGIRRCARSTFLVYSTIYHQIDAAECRVDYLFIIVIIIIYQIFLKFNFDDNFFETFEKCRSERKRGMQVCASDSTHLIFIKFVLHDTR